MMHSRAWLVAAVMLGLAFASPGKGLALTETEVQEGLLCYACPGEPLTADRCSGGDQMRAAIRSMIAEGKTKDQILGYFAAQLGENILTAPPKRGFNLVAYAGPFVGLLIGAVIATLVVRRMAVKGARTGQGEEPTLAPAPLDEATRERIDRELSHFDDEA